jgi:hypothetical protein
MAPTTMLPGCHSLDYSVHAHVFLPLMSRSFRESLHRTKHAASRQYYQATKHLQRHLVEKENRMHATRYVIAILKKSENA